MGMGFLPPIQILHGSGFVRIAFPVLPCKVDAVAFPGRIEIQVPCHILGNRDALLHLSVISGIFPDPAEHLIERVAAYEKEYGISTYSIYQLDLSDSTDGLRFMSLDWVQGKGLSVDRDNYRMVYAGRREPGETLEDIYRQFNIDHPEDFRGHSLSVSDVVVLHEKGTDTAYYVDSIGFKELPDFFGAGTPEAKRDVSMREQLDSARKQAAQAEPKAPDKKARGPERS